MLTTNRNSGHLPTSDLDVVDETGERRNATDQESYDCTPVCGELWRVAIDAVKVVHVGHGHVGLADDEVAVMVSVCDQWRGGHSGIRTRQ